MLAVHKFYFRYKMECSTKCNQQNTFLISAFFSRNRIVVLSAQLLAPKSGFIAEKRSRQGKFIKQSNFSDIHSLKCNIMSLQSIYCNIQYEAICIFQFGSQFILHAGEDSRTKPLIISLLPKTAMGCLKTVGYCNLEIMSRLLHQSISS